ncbi:GSCFA domain-containing protein [Amylibacter marinus]|uniref:GSCFA domain-containing protein n=1 Tax=Amylibacter marinus TaxID=1475483 RepID=UPI0024E0C325|nr:GSCFA domain-containing protein [Amylibacter marinus]
MPLEKIDANEAYMRALRNKFRQYPSRKKGVERLLPVPRINVSPSFTFGPDSRVFTSGSCFARYIEKSLEFSGFPILSLLTDLPELPDNSGFSPNKYSIFSVLNELRWAANKDDVDVDELLLENKDGTYLDLQINATLSADLDTMRTLRRIYMDSYAKAFEADVVIITLGFSQAWFDKKLGCYLNIAPSRQTLKQYPDRFEYHSLSYEDIYSALKEIQKLLAENSKTPPRLLLTVSPVPLVATFDEKDVLVANTYSKAVQRAALEQFCTEYDADYFPSYEIVTLSDMKYAWIDSDFRHVRPETVDRIMAQVLNAYTEGHSSAKLLEARGWVETYFAAGRYKKVIQLVEDLEEDGTQAPEALKLRQALSYRRMGRPDLAQIAFAAVAEMDGKHAEDAAKSAQLAPRAPIDADAQSPEDYKQEALQRLDDLDISIGQNADLDWLRSYVENSRPPESEVTSDSAKEVKSIVSSLKRLLDMKKYRSVVEQLDTSIEEWPNEPELHWHRGAAHRKLKNFSHAIDDMIVVANSSFKAADKARMLAISDCEKYDMSEKLKHLQGMDA